MKPCRKVQNKTKHWTYELMCALAIFFCVWSKDLTSRSLAATHLQHSCGHSWGQLFATVHEVDTTSRALPGSSCCMWQTIYKARHGMEYFHECWGFLLLVQGLKLLVLFCLPCWEGCSLDALQDSEENKGVHTGPYHACVADISRELKSVAYAQQESFENVQVQQSHSAGWGWMDDQFRP